MTIEFFVAGSPVPQGRPRVISRGGKTWTYDPPESVAYKATVASVAKGLKVRPLEGPLYMVLHFKMPRPKSVKKDVVYHTKRPDLDNFCKICSDALNGIAFADDSQVVQLAASKEYSSAPSQIGVFVKIGRVE